MSDAFDNSVVKLLNWGLEQPSAVAFVFVAALRTVGTVKNDIVLAGKSNKDCQATSP